MAAISAALDCGGGRVEVDVNCGAVDVETKAGSAAFAGIWLGEGAAVQAVINMPGITTLNTCPFFIFPSRLDEGQGESFEVKANQ